MEFRHLRCFLAVAEELHFARAAERLHIEQSPLSRAIKELEEELGIQLFVRTTRSTKLTHAGRLFLEHVPRVFTVLQQARDSVKAAANGFRGQLRMALSDGISPSRFSSFLALCRQEEPDVEIRLFEVSLAQQIKGLHDDLYDAGFAQSDEVGDGIVATQAWSDPLMVAVPARHPILSHKRIPVDELLRYPLVLCDPQACEGHARQVERFLRQTGTEPLVAELVVSCDLMMALVAAGFALGLTGESNIAACRESGIVGRSLAGCCPVLTTYLLRSTREPSVTLARFIERVYDTATGKHLLIPQGSRILGRYNSQVSYGQSRVQVVWNRIILPDTSSLTLDNLVGTDPAGYAGLEDGVDWHWDRVFAGAALTTLLGIGAELAAPENRQDGDRIIIAGRDGLQGSLNQVGQEMTRRNMNIQPTLTERPGLSVRIIVNRDLVLRPYQSLFFNRGTSR